MTLFCCSDVVVGGSVLITRSFCSLIGFGVGSSTFSDPLRLRLPECFPVKFLLRFGSISSNFGSTRVTGNRVFIPVGRCVLALNVFRLISSLFGIASDLIRRSFNLISGYMLGGSPGGKIGDCDLCSSFLIPSVGLLLNNFIISESLTLAAYCCCSNSNEGDCVANFGFKTFCIGFGAGCCCSNSNEGDCVANFGFKTFCIGFGAGVLGLSCPGDLSSDSPTVLA
ncbi:hypothetical protein QE152_g25612 [Popillia japonica]|uniref:Uncharacterized protein n=1 Tax=Popillia japonica TaxID=7064 RepID=A0AAW1K054_POPJA